MNLLICGGVPRGATTFLHTELSNYDNVSNSLIKESYLFERSNSLINLKLRTLPKNKIHLDFTPEYIFNKRALNKIAKRDIPCFFIIRPYADFVSSISKYLTINSIENIALKNISKVDYQKAVRFVGEHFLVFDFKEVVDSPLTVIGKIQSEFSLDFGSRSGMKEFRNDSAERHYRWQSFLASQFQAPSKVARSALFGLI
ncbi:hypothetical protein [Roseobacter sp.]|uniref:hypothetical protein n=1 Tax=Roseobacter sp. TaxID=1907202 RepID=UPI00385C0DF6